MRRLTLTLLLMVTALPAAAADVCPPQDSGKVDTVGDPATVTVTAPDGFLIDGYCVKAGPSFVMVTVDPPQQTVVVDHPTKDSVSHYSLSYTEVPPSSTTTTSTTNPPTSSTTITVQTTTTFGSNTTTSLTVTTDPPAPTTTVSSELTTTTQAMGSTSTSLSQPTLIPADTLQPPVETDPPPVTHTQPPATTPETLPLTGADPALMLGAALVALVAGGGAVAAGRRR